MGFALVANHPFVDGNERAGHAAMEGSLILNGFETDASAYEQERVVLDVASGVLDREEVTPWLKAKVVPIP